MDDWPASLGYSQDFTQVRVAIVSKNGEVGGGVETVVSWQLEVLRAGRAQVRIFKCPAWLNDKRLTLPYALGTFVFPATASILARLWAGKNGKVFSHGFSSIGLFCDTVFAHGCWAEFTKSTRARRTIYFYVMLFYECLAARLSRSIVAVSEEVKAAWMRNYRVPSGKCEVLHNTCDVRVFRPIISTNKPHQRSTFRILFAGRLEHAKGSDFLHQLLKDLEKDGSGDIVVKLCIPSDSSFKLPSWAAGVQTLFVKSKDGMAFEYNQSDALLLPSKYEAFEMVTVESLLCGTPVMLNNTGTRPFLEKLDCPGLFKLRPDISALEQVREARAAFQGISRNELATWARSIFDPEAAQRRLLELAGVR